MTTQQTTDHELNIIDQLQNYGEEYGIIHQSTESAEQYALRILTQVAEMIGELADVQKNILALNDE